MNTQSTSSLESVPVLILKIGQYPLSHGVLGAIRSLGRVGVSVYAICEDHFVPYAFSRFLSGGFVLPVIDYEKMGSDLLPHLAGMARILQKKSMLLPADDEAAIFVAEHAAALQQNYYIPRVDPGLPRLLASKYELSQLCRQHGVPIPDTKFARSTRDVLALAKDAGYPIVVKNSEPWLRLHGAAVSATTIVKSHDALSCLASTWQANPSVVLQEYIPHGVAEDWVFHAYFDSSSRPLVAFTGMKQRSWPPDAGVTAAAVALPNERLASLAIWFCRKIGYRGIVDMDWRYDRRDDQYKLVDCNPRLGANFALFVTDSGLDVVRAQHLDLTGQRVPASAQTFGRRFIVENLNLASCLFPVSDRRSNDSPAVEKVELAWFAADDPLPFVAMAFRFCGQVVLRLAESFIQLLKGTLIPTARKREASIWRILREALTREEVTDPAGGEFSPTDEAHQGSKGWRRSQSGEIETGDRRLKRP